jgi:hypothetical protein
VVKQKSYVGEQRASESETNQYGHGILGRHPSCSSFCSLYSLFALPTYFTPRNLLSSLNPHVDEDVDDNDVEDNLKYENIASMIEILGLQPAESIRQKPLMRKIPREPEILAV